LVRDAPEFSISVLLTSDEEIMGLNGTKRVVEYLRSINEKITSCVLCESCSPGDSGEYIKIGCRGSLNVDLTSRGRQSHVASGGVFGNHIREFLGFLNEFLNKAIDQGNENFAPSGVEITSIDVGNDIRNVIPSSVSAKLNIRFNDTWKFDALETYIEECLPPGITVSFERFGAPFIGATQPFVSFLSNVVEKAINITPQVGTSGGNSDAVFIKDLTNVAEIGSPIAGAHIVNEFISVADLSKLRDIYLGILREFPNYGYFPHKQVLVC
jgi:succinyl-diaminopimelate desuccinylase